MSIEKRIHRKASDYVAAMQNTDAPELQPRKAGRPTTDSQSAAHHIHLRVTKQRKNFWVGAAYPKTLAQWMTENLDKAANKNSK